MSHVGEGPPGAESRAFTMLGPPFDAVLWTLVSMTGYEAINELFRFEAVITAPREAIEAFRSAFDFHQELPRQDVAFSFGDASLDGSAPPSSRFAMIVAAHHLGIHRIGDAEHVRLRLELAPRAWLLTQRRNSRIFQDEYLHEIVSAVLHENGIRHAWDLSKQYPRRLYCTQYQETDWEFVTRLFAEEGILFYFKHWQDESSPQGFVGGEPAKIVAAGGFDQDWKTAMDVAKVAGDLGKGLSAMAGGIAGSSGEDGEAVAGGFEMAGAAFGMAGDLAKALRGEDEAPVRELGSGQAGPAGPGDVLVFVDASGYEPSLDEADEIVRLSLEEGIGMVAPRTHRFETLSNAQRTVVERVAIRDYDFRKPLLLLEEAAPRDEGDDESGAPLEQYEHHGDFETPDIVPETAQIRLEQHQRDLATYDMKSRSPVLKAGHFFDLERPDQPGTDSLVVTRIHHEFHAQAPVEILDDREGNLEALVQACARAIHEAARDTDLGEEQLRDTMRGVLSAPFAGRIVYQNFCTCVPRNVPYRPPRPERVMRNVTESATVMGPEGKDLYTDRYGRVKVQFHWDREGEFNQKSSVWMRVVQPWAGAGYGFQFFPRVGMEVLVTFLGGDPDRPIVLGSLYNGTHPTPEPLPERMTRSGIRTQSTPRGGGFNELSFDDAKGEERVYLHAERDFHAVVNHSHELKVKHGHTVEVGARQQIAVEGQQLTAIGGHQATNVGADQACNVGGSRRDRVVGNATERVEGNALEEVHGIAVRKCDMHELTLVRGNRDLTVWGNCTAMIQGPAFGYVDDKVQLNARKRVVLVSEEGVTIRVGTSVVVINEDEIIFEADTVSLLGRDLVQISGAEVVLETPSGTMARLREDGATLRGYEINLTSPERSGGPLDPATHPANVKLKFTHLALEHGGDPIANTPFVVTTPTKGGLDWPLSGTTNGDGEIEFHAPDEIDSVEINLAVNNTYPDIYPGDQPLRFMVKLGRSFGQADELKGARIRLNNLGYRASAALNDEDFDASTRQALLDFQLEAEIPRTGRMDDRTTEKLRDLYGS